MDIEPTVNMDPTLVDDTLSENGSVSPKPITNTEIVATAGDETRQIATAAGVIGLGNVASRILGLLREIVKSNLFGAGAAVDAFNIATVVPTMIYDLLSGGMVDSALVPVFSSYAEDKRKSLWGLVSVILNLTLILMTLISGLLWLFAPTIAALLNTNPEADLVLTTQLLRVTVPAVLFLSLSGVLSGLLYSLKRFAFPAFTAAVFNAAIVAVTLLFHEQLGITAMALGLLAGAVAQVALQLPGIRDALRHLRVAFKHPGLRQIIKLYAPIMLGLLFEIFLNRLVSYRLASDAIVGGISWMNYATTLRQLPQGLVAIAVSFAILPTLSVHASNELKGSSAEAFRQTLARGLRLVMVLIVPASAGLFVLGQPVIDLVLEHGSFTPFDTQMTSIALYLYLIGLPFAAIDLVLIFAFYARQNTLIPAIIGVVANIAYLFAAVALLRGMGLFALMVADSFKQLLHAVIAGYILRRRVGGLSSYGIGRATLMTCIATGIMSIVVYGLLLGLNTILPTSDSIVFEATKVLIPGAVGAGLYLWLVTAFGVEEIRMLWSAVQQRIAR